MNKISLILTLLSLISTPSFGAESAAPAKKSEAYGQLEDSKTSTLQKLMDIPAVKQQHEKCKKEQPERDLGDCLWEVDEGTKKLIQAKLSQLEGKEKKYEGLDLAPVSQTDDPAIKKLEKYFEERLDKALHGENAKDHKNMVDHQVFNNLYRSQIGKGIIQAISSYCLEASIQDEGKFKASYLIPNDSKTIREENLELLKQGEVANNKWEQCMFAIPKVCHQRSEDPYKHNGLTITYTGPAGGFASCKLESQPGDCHLRSGSKEKSTQRACVVVEYLEKGRQTLKDLDVIDKQYANLGKKEEEKQTGFKQLAEQDVKHQVDVDGATTFTSGEIAKSGYGDESDKMEKEFEKCYKDNKIIDREACKKFVGEDGEEQEKLIAEYAIRLRAMQAKIDEEVTSADGAKKYLKDAGDDKELDKKLQGNAEEIQKRIQKNYAQKRKELIASLQADAQKKSINKKDLEPGSDQKEELGKKAANIGDDIKEKDKKLAQIVHFSNIVSGYLEFKNSGDKKTGQEKQRNTRVLYEELKNVSNTIYTEQGTGPSPASAGADHTDETVQAIKQQAQKDGIKENKKNPDQTTVDIDAINQILNYGEQAPSQGQQQ